MPDGNPSRLLDRERLGILQAEVVLELCWVLHLCAVFRAHVLHLLGGPMSRIPHEGYLVDEPLIVSLAQQPYIYMYLFVFIHRERPRTFSDEHVLFMCVFI